MRWFTCCVQTFLCGCSSSAVLLAMFAGSAQASVVNIYWSDSGNVNRANPGGANQINLAAGLSRVDDVEIDQGASLAFWNNWIVTPGEGPQPGPGEGIYQSNLVGSGQSPFSAPCRVVLDDASTHKKVSLLQLPRSVDTVPLNGKTETYQNSLI